MGAGNALADCERGILQLRRRIAIHTEDTTAEASGRRDPKTIGILLQWMFVTGLGAGHGLDRGKRGQGCLNGAISIPAPRDSGFWVVRRRRVLRDSGDPSLQD